MNRFNSSTLLAFVLCACSSSSGDPATTDASASGDSATGSDGGSASDSASAGDSTSSGDSAAGDDASTGGDSSTNPTDATMGGDARCLAHGVACVDNTDCCSMHCNLPAYTCQ